MRCRIADINIEIRNNDPATETAFEKFLCDFDAPDIVIPLTVSEVEDAMKGSPYANSFAYTESFCAFRKLSGQLAGYDAFLMHGTAVRVKDRGIIFSAPSGTGKTTHMLLWKRLFGKELTVINGDKPIVRMKDGTAFAWGTPWCGKEGYFENESVRLTDICFIERAAENRIRRVDPGEAVGLILQQILIRGGGQDTLKTLGMADRLLAQCRVWKIYCNKEPDAAVIASEAIFTGDEENEA